LELFYFGFCVLISHETESRQFENENEHENHKLSSKETPF